MHAESGVRRRCGVPALRRVLATLLLAIALAAPSIARANNCAGGGKPRPDEGGVGGTGHQPSRPVNEGGIGGTGHADGGGVGGDGPQAAQPPNEGGIGGTGVIADRGIIGTITGFASICVGELEIHYSESTAVEIDGQPTTVSQLAVGQVAEVEASGSGSEVQAKSIVVRHLVSGPVTRVDTSKNRVEVMGQAVQLSDATLGDDDAAISAAALSPEAIVRVSGLRRADGVIVASRVNRGDAVEGVRVTGPIVGAERNLIVVGGVPVRIEGSGSVRAGSEVRVVGHWDGRVLVAAATETVPRVPFEGRVARLDIEGFAQKGSGHLRVGAYRVEMGRRGLAPSWTQVAGGERVRVHAVLQDRRVVAERIDRVPAPPSAPSRPDNGLRAPRRDDAGDSRRPEGDRQSVPGEPRPWPPRPDGHGEDLRTRPDDAGGFEKPGKPDRPDKPGVSDVPFDPERVEPGSRPDRIDKPDRLGKPDRPDKPERSDRPDRPVVPDRPSAPEVPERPAAPDIPSVPDRPILPERPVVPNVPSVPDRPILPDRPAPPDRPVRPEPPQRPDRAERPDRPARPDVPDSRPR